MLGPRPVPHSVTACASMAGCEVEFWAPPEMKSSLRANAGPDPKLLVLKIALLLGSEISRAFHVKIPKLLLTTVKGTGLLTTPCVETCTETRPSGAFEDMMALICDEET